MPGMASHDVLVRGGGAVGLAAALALSRLGLEVALLEAAAGGAGAAPTGEDVRAYALNRASVDLLASLKAWDAIDPADRTPVHDMRVEGDAPGAVLEFSAWAQAEPELAWIVGAAALEDALRAAVRFAPRVTRVPAPVPAALTVLAEGKDSATRAALGARMVRHPYGQRAIAARLEADLPHAGRARQWFRSPDVLALLPTDRPRAGHGLALVWSLPEERASELLALPPAAFEAALADATGGAAGVLSLVGPRVAWPLSIGRAAPLHGPGWVLVGDAAHVVHPLAGQGLNLGLADVASLAAVLAAREGWRPLGDERLLARHARAREGPVHAMGLVTDGLLHLFSSQAPLARELRNRGLGLVNRLPPVKQLLAQRAIGGAR
jgi:2-polyprenyl-6-methoxyphenol hydroxylase-like FAD-dependent oxidoreductase